MQNQNNVIPSIFV